MPKPGDTLTMNEKVINRFFLLKTHRASTSQLEISSFKHLFCRYFPFGSCPSQKTSFERGLGVRIPLSFEFFNPNCQLERDFFPALTGKRRVFSFSFSPCRPVFIFFRILSTFKKKENQLPKKTHLHGFTNPPNGHLTHLQPNWNNKAAGGLEDNDEALPSIAGRWPQF